MKTSPTPWRIAGINFDHMHMGDLLGYVQAHPGAELVGVFHPTPEPMAAARERFAIPEDRVFTALTECLERSRPDVVILCPATGEHADYVEAVAPYGVHVLVEKPFAASLAEADRMIAAMAPGGRQMMINWPSRWFPSYVMAQRLLAAGHIGTLLGVRHLGGNRGPLRVAGEVVRDPAEKAKSWFYQREKGGGSLLDYLGYGTTMGTWFHAGRAPLEVTCVVDEPAGLEVEEHSVTIARYESGLSRFETHWGMFTDPWVTQPQPRCGFTLHGTEGTLACYDYAPVVYAQTSARPEVHEIPAEPLQAPERNPIEYFLHRLDTDQPVEGPLSPALCRTAQRIIETARRSAREKRTLPLV